VVDRCREGERLACSTIVASQTHHVAAFQVPEPWTSGEMLLLHLQRGASGEHLRSQENDSKDALACPSESPGGAAWADPEF
jgi:hypothetical protein